MKMFKKGLTLLIAICSLLIVSCGGTPKAGGQDELDMAIRDASDYLNDNIPAQSKIVILNIQSDSAALSDYIIDELIANAVNDRLFEVVDRQQLDMIRQEQNFQWAGEVSDQTALEIGNFLGAQIIVSGRVSQVADRYRFTIRALEVQTARVVGQNNTNIAAGRTITSLMRGGSGGTATAASGGRTQTTTPAPTATAPTAIANGTYYFWPRPQARQAGMPVNAFLDKIVVQGNYLLIYLAGAARGEGGDPQGNNNWYANIREYILQDLDTPRLTYQPVTVTYELPRTLSFQNVRTGKRFSLTYTWDQVHVIFEEINLDDAEYEP